MFLRNSTLQGMAPTVRADWQTTPNYAIVPDTYYVSGNQSLTKLGGFPDRDSYPFGQHHLPGTIFVLGRGGSPWVQRDGNE